MSKKFSWFVLLAAAVVVLTAITASAKSDRYQKTIKEWRGHVDRAASAVKETMAKPHDPNELMKQEAFYVECALELYSCQHDGTYPKSLRELKQAGLLREFPGGLPPSPYGRGRIVTRGLNDKLSPGALVYIPGPVREGSFAGFWLIAIGKPDKPWNYALIEPLPDGATVPADAVVVLESHIDETPEPMTKL